MIAFAAYQNEDSGILEVCPKKLDYLKCEQINKFELKKEENITYRIKKIILESGGINEMICPRCKKDDPQNREMCPDCGYPVKPIPVPPGGKIRFGDYDWFVLDRQNGKALIITEKVIEKRPYHNMDCEITWETCDMRKYLNGEFYNSFNEADLARIAEVVNENPNNSWYGTSGGKPTSDKVFLLSIAEVVKYFGDSGQIKSRYMYPNCEWCKDEFLPWIDDQYNINRRAVDDDDIVQHWKLRSPGANSWHIAEVTGFCGDGFDQGSISLGGGEDVLIDGHFIYDGSGHLSGFLPNGFNPNGVRPALWLREE